MSLLLLLFAHALLGCVQHVSFRMHRDVTIQQFDRARRDIFKFKGDDMNAPGDNKWLPVSPGGLLEGAAGLAGALGLPGSQLGPPDERERVGPAAARFDRRPARRHPATLELLSID